MGPKISSIVAVTFTGFRPLNAVASMIRLFMGQGQSG
jgi:hypothetical protein